jgi:uncharacterized protein YrrD
MKTLFSNFDFLGRKTTMDIPVDVDVYCQDGLCGRSTYVILNPTRRTVTHVVVQKHGFVHSTHLVPIDHIVESTAERITLRCTQAEVLRLPTFLETEFVPSEQAEDYLRERYEGDAFMLWPYRSPEDDMALVDVEQVPPGELAIPRGTAVKATDGHVGHVDEFLINPETGHITHLILGEGHLWGHKEVMIPVSAIKQIEEDGVYLQLDKESIKQLPAIPLKK